MLSHGYENIPIHFRYNIESLVKLKGNSEECIFYELCIICQRSKNDTLFDASEKDKRVAISYKFPYIVIPLTE